MTAAHPARNRVLPSREPIDLAISVAQGRAQIAGQNAAKPAKISGVGRLIQSHLRAQIRERLLRRRLPENCLSGIPWERFDPQEDHSRNREQK